MKRGELWTAAGGRHYAGKPRPVLLVQDDRFDVAAGTSGPRAARRLAAMAKAVTSGTVLDAALREHSPSAGVLQTERGARAYSFTP